MGGASRDGSWAHRDVSMAHRDTSQTHRDASMGCSENGCARGTWWGDQEMLTDDEDVPSAGCAPSVEQALSMMT